MLAWIVHEPYTDPATGRDYRPGDTLVAEDTPDCDATLLHDASDDAPRRGRPRKAQSDEVSE